MQMQLLNERNCSQVGKQTDVSDDNTAQRRPASLENFLYINKLNQILSMVEHSEPLKEPVYVDCKAHKTCPHF